MLISEELIRKALAERKMNEGDIDLVIKQATVEDQKQEDPNKGENPADGSKDEPKQEGGEPNKPVEDKEDGHKAENGGEPKADNAEPKQENPNPAEAVNQVAENEANASGGEPKASADDSELKAIKDRMNSYEAQIKDLKTTLEGVTESNKAYVEILTKMGIPLNQGDPKQIGGDEQSGEQSLAPDYEQDYAAAKKLMGYK